MGLNVQQLMASSWCSMWARDMLSGLPNSPASGGRPGAGQDQWRGPGHVIVPELWQTVISAWQQLPGRARAAAPHEHTRRSRGLHVFDSIIEYV
jgi:hypothetical protein